MFRYRNGSHKFKRIKPFAISCVCKCEGRTCRFRLKQQDDGKYPCIKEIIKHYRHCQYFGRGMLIDKPQIELTKEQALRHRLGLRQNKLGGLIAPLPSKAN